MITSFSLTTLGENLLAKAQGGTELKFTKIMVGDGILQSGQSIRDLVGMISPKKTFGISDKSVSGSSAVVTTMFTNQGITTAFLWREVGLFALDPVEGEILYAFGYNNANPIKIESESTTAMSFTYGMQTIIKDAPNVTAVIDPSAEFLKRDELKKYVAIEGGAVGATIVTFSEQDTATVAEIASGAKLAVLVGKIKKLLSDLVGFRDRESGFATAAQGTKADNAVPKTRTVNNKPLSADITLTSSDVGALSTSGNAVSASKLQTARTIGIIGKAMAAGVAFDGSKDINFDVTEVDATKLGGQASSYYASSAGMAKKGDKPVPLTANLPLSGWIAEVSEEFKFRQVATVAGIDPGDYLYIASAGDPNAANYDKAGVQIKDAPEMGKALFRARSLPKTDVVSQIYKFQLEVAQDG